MGYLLKLFDENLIAFDVKQNLADPVLKIIWINEEKKHLMPLGMEVSDFGLSQWIRHRSIPKNRAFVNAFLSKCGLSANRPMDVVSVCRGLSLNDSYWVTDESFAGTFEDSNLYKNKFSRILANVAFSGYGSTSVSAFMSSPEFTTNGTLPKCWRRESGRVYLYKGATSGASNTGSEPYSEMYAGRMAKVFGVNCVDYSIRKWKGQTCSVCEIFTSEDFSYVPVGRIVQSGGLSAVRDYYMTLGREFVSALDEMIVFDALIFNTDRHFGNFGVMVDSHTNKIVAPAPLFDHGNSLFNFAGTENFENAEVLGKYADTLMPRVYEDFVSEARNVMNDSMREKVRRFLNYRLEKQGKYNYSDRQLACISEVVRKRAAELLK